MAFTDYLDLRTAVLEEVGDKSILDKFDRLTRLAESQMNRKLRTRGQITTLTITVADNEYTLPDDYVAVIGLQDGSGCEYVQDSWTLNAYAEKYGRFACDGTRMVAPNGEYTFSYYSKLPSVVENNTNAIFAEYPDFYLIAVKAEAFKTLNRLDEAGLAMRETQRILGEIRRDDMSARFSAAEMRVTS